MSALSEVMRENVYVHAGGEEFGDACAKICQEHGFAICHDPAFSYFAIAPRLTRILKREEWTAPELGTLIFHPSILPYRRGRDAIRHTIVAGERVSGVTWFWCDSGIDTGPICEQEPVLMKPGERAGQAYRTRFIPAGLRALERVLIHLRQGGVRSLAQDEALATYDRRLGV
ncbi:MAG: formyltransferase family protein [Candidatus Zixiibacteriota bacterium]